MTKTHETRIERFLIALLQDDDAVNTAWADTDTAEDPYLNIRRFVSFEEAGILTTDKGLVIRTTDGCEYQVTIKRTR